MKPLNPDYPAMVKEVRTQLALNQEVLARAQLGMFCEKMEKRAALVSNAVTRVCGREA